MEELLDEYMVLWYQKQAEIAADGKPKAETIEKLKKVEADILALKGR